MTSGIGRIRTGARATAPCARCCACQPYTMLRPEHYEQWKDIEITFDPRDMFGG